MEIFYILIMVVVMQLYKFVRMHRTVHQKRVNFIVCKLYFPKGDFKKEKLEKTKSQQGPNPHRLWEHSGSCLEPALPEPVPLWTQGFSNA